MSYRKTISIDELLKILKQTAECTNILEIFKSNNISNLLLLCSDEHIRIKRFVSWIRDHNKNSDYVPFFGSDLNSKNTLQNFESLVNSLSLFSKNNLIAIYDCDSIKANAQKNVISTLEKSTENNLIILITKREVSKTSIASKINNLTTEIILPEIKNQLQTKWIEKEFQRINPDLKLENGVLQYLAENLGSDISRLVSEIERLCLINGNSSILKLEQVRLEISKANDSNSFELIQKISTKNTEDALKICNILIEQGMHPLQISSFLNKAFRIIAANKETKLEQQKSKELTNFWFLKQLSNSIRNFAIDDLKKIFEVLKKLDFQLKDSGLSPEICLLNSVQMISNRTYSI